MAPKDTQTPAKAQDQEPDPLPSIAPLAQKQGVCPMTETEKPQLMRHPVKVELEDFASI